MTTPLFLVPFDPRDFEKGGEFTYALLFVDLGKASVRPCGVYRIGVMSPGISVSEVVGVWKLSEVKR